MPLVALFAVDIAAITLLTFALYFPRHRRKDMVVAFLGINIGVLGVTQALASAEVSAGLGLGLFGVLSIIRLRSSEMEQAEVAYYFAALALGLLGGFAVSPAWMSPALMAAIVVAVGVGDHPSLFGRYRRQVVILDRAYTNDVQLRARLDELVGGKVHRVTVHKVDLVNDTTTAEVRYEHADDVQKPADVAAEARARAMTVAMLIPAVDSLVPVTLGELDAVAALQARTDRKYVIAPDQLDELIERVASTARVLDIEGRRTFDYESVYFDTPDLQSYLATARRRPNRFKVRTRTYVDSGRCAIEVKLRDRHERTIKHRIDHDIDRQFALTESARSFVEGFAMVRPFGPSLRPTLTTCYQRSTMLIGGGRVTIDIDVMGTDRCGRTASLGEYVVVETKSAQAAGPLDKALWAMHVRPVTISKYGTLLAAAHPTLPSNRWRRTLDRHVRGQGH